MADEAVEAAEQADRGYGHAASADTPDGGARIEIVLTARALRDLPAGLIDALSWSVERINRALCDGDADDDGGGGRMIEDDPVERVMTLVESLVTARLDALAFPGDEEIAEAVREIEAALRAEAERLAADLAVCREYAAATTAMDRMLPDDTVEAGEVFAAGVERWQAAGTAFWRMMDAALARREEGSRDG